MSEKEKHYKVVLIGDANIGKTSLIHQLIDGKCEENGYSFLSIPANSQKELFDPSSETVYYLDFWDTSGSVLCRSGNRFICADCDVIVYIASFDNLDSLNSLPVLYKGDINGFKKDKKFLPLFFINKSDIVGTENQKVTDEDIHRIENELGIDGNKIEKISAKTGEGVKDIPINIGTKLCEMFPFVKKNENQNENDPLNDCLIQ